MAEDIKNITIDNFFDIIQNQNGIAPLWKKVINMLSKMGSIPEDSACLKVLCIYFSLLDDGNTCIVLDSEQLLNKWMEKWNGLLLVSNKESELTEDVFKAILEEGIDEILGEKFPALFETSDLPSATGINKILEVGKPFLIKEINNKKWLFASKYYSAKLSIEDRIQKIFNQTKTSDNLKDECNKVVSYFEKNTLSKKLNKPITLNEEQAQAIVLGKTNNLILTGGPGTGKTTAVCYLLFELMKLKDASGKSYCDYNLYLAAPSGKAAERMKESISGSLKDFLPELITANEKIVEKLTVTDSSTIHRLLSYNPSKNDFNFNKDNQFEDNSIFVIDESSMIDIHLFKCLLEAIPDAAKVFILGDKDQLPSVQAGAVLGELLAKRKNSVVALTKSNRFNEESQVGRLKNELQKSEEFGDMSAFGTWLDSYDDFKFLRSNSVKNENEEKNPVFFYEIKTADKEKKIPSKKDQIKSIANKWSSTFCNDLVAAAKLGNKDSLDLDAIKYLWKLSIEAKILCAEREGPSGVDGFNNTIIDLVCSNTKSKRDEDGFFTGELLIMTKNQNIFRLYNGDSGIVVSFNDEMKYLMVEKKASNNDSDSVDKSGIFRLGDFLFYPLYLLPKDSMETAYAITIHKSQGSGYKNIMVVFPEQEGHPLLNRQIAYTAITRTEGNTYIIASKKAMNYAKKTIIQRDTNIEL